MFIFGGSLKSPIECNSGGNTIKGMGEASYKLDSGKYMKMKDVLNVPGLKKNLLSISALDKKGFRVSL